MIALIPALIGICIAIGYNLLVSHKSPKQLWNWRHSFISTLVSVLLGVSVAIMIFQHQRSITNKENRSRYTQLLRLELSGIRSHLQDSLSMNILTPSGIRKASVTFLHPIVLSDAGKSGLFSDEDSWMIIEVANSVNAYNSKVQLLLDIISSSKRGPGLDMCINSAILNIENSRQGILKGIDILSDQLGIELVENIGSYETRE